MSWQKVFYLQKLKIFFFQQYVWNGLTPTDWLREEHDEEEDDDDDVVEVLQLAVIENFKTHGRHQHRRTTTATTMSIPSNWSDPRSN